MPSKKIPAKSKPKSKGKPAPAKKAKSPKPAKSPSPKKPRVPISPLTGLPVREKIHLPIKGFGRLNGFEVLQNLFGKSAQQLKEILAYEEKHQSRRMVIDRINDMLRRAGK